MSKPQVLFEQPRGDREVLRVALSEYAGKRFADLRVWYHDRDGELRPGRAGVTLRAGAIPEVIDALGRARQMLDGSA